MDYQESPFSLRERGSVGGAENGARDKTFFCAFHRAAYACALNGGKRGLLAV